MADEHRKVQPRGAIPGTGMLNDPERIEEVQRRASRFQRDTAPPTKKKFGEVLGKSLGEISQLGPEDLLEDRYRKFRMLGAIEER